MHLKSNPCCIAWSRQQKSVSQINSDKAELICFNKDSTILFNDVPPKLFDQYLDSKISLTESDISIHIDKPWTANDKLLLI